MGTTWPKSDSGVISMILGSTPSQQRRVVAEVAEFYDPPRYVQTEHLPALVARGKLDIAYLQLKDRFSACSEASHIRDVLLVEGFYARPPEAEDYDKRRKSARERVKKRRQRANQGLEKEEPGEVS